MIEEEDRIETIDICGPKSSDHENNFYFKKSNRHLFFSWDKDMCALRFNSSGIIAIIFFPFL